MNKQEKQDFIDKWIIYPGIGLFVVACICFVFIATGSW